jgi:predicted transcriptional regulator
MFPHRPPGGISSVVKNQKKDDFSSHDNVQGKIMNTHKIKIKIQIKNKKWYACHFETQCKEIWVSSYLSPIKISSLTLAIWST